MAAPVIIRVGCALDTSVEKTFGDIERRAQKAGQRVAAALGQRSRRVLDDGAVRAHEQAEKRGVDATKAATAQKNAEARKAAKVSEQAEKAHTRAATQESRKRLATFRAEMRQRLADNRKWVREAQQEERAHTRARNAEARKQAQNERAAMRASAKERRELDRFATRTSHRATRFLWPNAPLASMGRRAGSEILRGIGLDTTIAGSVGRARELETSSTELSTAGYISGASGKAGERQSAADLTKEARAIGTEVALDPQQINDAAAQFVRLTGNLEAARGSMKDLAKISVAAGATLEDTAGMAGEVWNALGNDYENPEDKIKAMMYVMRKAGSQGKIGSVEMADFAKYYAHLGGTAGKFGGSRSETLTKLGALAQIAKTYGGSTSAAAATRAVSGMGDTMSKGARRKMFAKYNVALEDERGMFRDPLEILKDSIRNTGGKTAPMQEMWANVLGAKGATGLTNIYKDAGGGEAGMAAIEKVLKESLDAESMNPKAIEEAVAEHLKTTASKTQIFQNKLDQITEKALGELLPALEALAPQALKVAEGMGDLAIWLAQNPGKAIGVAIAASIARAGLESLFRGALERVIIGAAGGTAPGAKVGGGFMPAGGALGAGAAGLTILATAVTLFAAGAVIIDQVSKASSEASKKSVGEWVGSSARIGTLRRQIRERGGEATPEQVAALKKEEAGLSKTIGEAEGAVQFGKMATPGELFGMVSRLARGLVGAEGGTDVTGELKRGEDAARIDELKAEMRGVQDLLRAGIRVTNIEDARTPPAMPGVGPAGREPKS
jgi:TP901 family phage tail tape measure protein